MNLAEIIDVLEAFRGGKDIQLRKRPPGDHVWIDFNPHAHEVGWNFIEWEWRRKPEPKIGQWKLENAPAGWVRQKLRPYGRSLIVGITKDGVHVLGLLPRHPAVTISFEDLFSDHEYSADGISDWGICGWAEPPF